ncbi:MAG: hypothetical protein EHM13_06270 [Acidobacteria bacterium]|nr:MAG: hypothetical protein EHM13_06270 [Acidobacteriota bacterium]
MSHTTTRRKGTHLVLQVEAETLEEARESVRSQTPRGYTVFSEAVVSEGAIAKAEARADTADDAFKKVFRGIPRNADVVARTVLAEPRRRTITVAAADEEEARKLAADQTRPDEAIGDVTMLAPGRKGFGGIGRRPNSYEVHALRQARVEVAYRQKARIDVEIGFGGLSEQEWTDTLTRLTVTEAETDYAPDPGVGDAYSNTTLQDPASIVRHLLDVQDVKGVSISIDDTSIEVDDKRPSAEVTTRYYRVGDAVWQRRQQA